MTACCYSKNLTFEEFILFRIPFLKTCYRIRTIYICIKLELIILYIFIIFKILVFLTEEFHGQRSLVGYSPWGHKESDMTEQLSLLANCNISSKLRV